MTASVCAGADGLVLPSGELREELAGYLTAQAETYWTARSAKVAALSSPAQVRERQQYIRHWMLDAMAFPAKTPLKAKITGGFARDGYRIEHLIFESQPKFYVTANVYIPTDVKGPFPAVLGVAGHSATGKAIDTYQYAWIGGCPIISRSCRHGSNCIRVIFICAVSNGACYRTDGDRIFV